MQENLLTVDMAELLSVVELVMDVDMGVGVDVAVLEEVQQVQLQGGQDAQDLRSIRCVARSHLRMAFNTLCND